MSAPLNYRLINIDRLDPDHSSNFDLSTLVPADTGAASISSSAEAQSLAGQIRQLLRGGDTEGALRGAMENVPYGGDDRAKVGKNHCLSEVTLDLYLVHQNTRLIYHLFSIA